MQHFAHLGFYWVFPVYLIQLAIARGYQIEGALYPVSEGLIIAAVITAVVPDDFFAENLPATGILAMLVMVILGVPVYVCATASVPVAAALIAKGLAPGVALVFLITGPATNAASITVVAKLLGKPVAAVYVTVIALCALMMGMAVNVLYGWLAIDITSWTTGMKHSSDGWFSVLAALALLALIARSLIKKS